MEKTSPVLLEGDSTLLIENVSKYNNFYPFDIVYLDPPYSTGYAFSHYDDNMGKINWRIWFKKILIGISKIIHKESLIIIHLDDNQSHYAKVIADGIFWEESFRNEIILKRTQKNTNETSVNILKRMHDVCLIYKQKGKINNITIKSEKKPYWHSFEAPGIRKTLEYSLFGHKPSVGNHWRWSKDRAEKSIRGKTLRPNPTTNRPEYLVIPEKQSIGTLWTDKVSYDYQKGFQTAKSVIIIERLLSLYPVTNGKRVVVLDPFLGSGTTLEACTHLGFDFVGIDLKIEKSIKDKFTVTEVHEPSLDNYNYKFIGKMVAAKW